MKVQGTKAGIVFSKKFTRLFNLPYNVVLEVAIPKIT